MLSPDVTETGASRKACPDHVDSVGARRRLQALTAIGWHSQLLALAFEVDVDTVTAVRAGRVDRIPRRLHQRIADRYRDLRGTRRSGTAQSTGATGLAASQHWAPPDAWCDGDPAFPDDLPDEIDDPTALPDTAYRLADVTAAAQDSSHVLTEQQIDAIRDTYRRAAPHTLHRGRLAAAYGVRPQVITQAITGQLVAGYTDLRTHRTDRWARNPGSAGRTSDTVIDTVRAEYAAGRSVADICRSRGITDSTARRMIRGHIRADRRLTDLTAHPRGANSAAASPADSDDRKENAA